MPRVVLIPPYAGWFDRVWQGVHGPDGPIRAPAAARRGREG
jgi:hypothetical protein